jgi:hypothetical protein
LRRPIGQSRCINTLQAPSLAPAPRDPCVVVRAVVPTDGGQTLRGRQGAPRGDLGRRWLLRCRTPAVQVTSSRRGSGGSASSSR